MNTHTITGNIVDVIRKEIYRGTLYITDGFIDSIVPLAENKKNHINVSEIENENLILPGFIDAHVHIESSLLTPSAFARLAVVHGTVGSVSDPHEIANVLGIGGVRYMISNGKAVPFHFNFGAPSCVPATGFESSGAVITADEIKELLMMDDIKYLSEMMNFPGVIFEDQEVKRKIQFAHEAGKVIDGHAPGLSGHYLKKYFENGILTDHECTTYSEAREKADLGMNILIRECSVVKNFDDLIPLMDTHPGSVMFCSDDAHPTELINGHMNLLVKRALAKGYDLFEVLRAVTVNPKKHYSLANGLLQPGDSADLVVIDNLSDFNIKQTFVKGIKVAENGKCLFDAVCSETPNRFNCNPISVGDLGIAAESNKMKVIKAIEGQLLTRVVIADVKTDKGYAVADVDKDILKIIVVNRYRQAKPAVAFINNFGLKRGALASTIAHDSHNIIAIGTNDHDLTGAVNLLIENKGGIALYDKDYVEVLPLPVAGLMTNADGQEVAAKYLSIQDIACNKLGCTLKAPFMTLSFMALLVIPELKLSDKGLFDGTKFEFTSMFL